MILTIYYRGENHPVEFVKSSRPDLADYTSNIAFEWAKKYKKKPAEIAEQIVKENINLKAANGFLNLSLADRDISQKLTNRPRIRKQYSVLIDFGGPNIAKEMHVGHLRSLVIGKCLYNVARHCGYTVVSDIHYGDWGLQMGLLLAADHIGMIDLKTASLSEIASTYALCSSKKDDEAFMKLAHEFVIQLQRKDPDAVDKWDAMVKKTKASVNKNLSRLGISFDMELGESDSAPYIEIAKTILKPVMSEGALVLENGEGQTPLVLQNQYGGYLYAATDLGTMLMRSSIDEIVYVVDNRQHYHFEQVFKHSEKLFEQPKELVHVGFGTVNGPDGLPFKTRDGGVPLLSSLLDEAVSVIKDKSPDLDDEDIQKIAMGAIKFSDLINKRTKGYNFDIVAATDPIGKTGPYIQYQITRLRALGLYDPAYTDHRNPIFPDYARPLMIILCDYQDTIQKVWDTKMPHHLAQYLYDLASEFSSVYANNANLRNSSADMYWMYNVYNTLVEGMKLLGIDIPSKM